ncbi:helix-turn-helix domain-containing protein [Kitasatospora sp. NPDC003701]
MVVRKRSALAVQRDAAGHTQESLAEALGLDRSTVGRWERGKGEPRPWQRPRLAEELGVGLGELKDLIQSASAATASEQDMLSGDPTGKSPARLAVPRSTAHVAGAQLGDSNTHIIDWAAAGPAGESRMAGGRLWATADEIDVAEGTLGMFRQLDHTYGARRYAPRVAAYISGELADLLARPTATEEVVRCRARVATGFLELAGYQAVDNGDHEQAQSFYRRALTLTAAANDRPYGAYLVAVNLGHLALHCGRPRIALTWASSAHTAVGTLASPATRAAITAVLARAHARLGEEPEASRLLVQAESLLDGADPEDEPGWIGYFTPAYLADEAAHCLHDLGHAPAARHQLADALDGVGRDKVRRLAIDATLLASTWLRTGDLDQACTVGTEAVGYAARTDSGRCVQRVAGLLVELELHASHSAVAELREFAREVLPDADQLALSMRRIG